MRPRLDDLNLSIGKKTRLGRLLYKYGPANGTLLLLPIDQGLEHGPVDFLSNPDSEDPEFQLKLAKDGNYSGIVFHIGLAEKYMKKYAGDVPLVLKLNGKTNIPAEDEAFSPLDASVEDAVRLGADAVGYTLYVGSPSQELDISQFNQIRQSAERYGMPVIMWSYPRGRAIEAKGGKNSVYAVDYAARVACELGADVVKLNMPEFKEDQKAQYPKAYQGLKLNDLEAMKKVIKSAGRTMVLVSGGSKLSDEDLINKVNICLKAGATGLIFGRNMWQRKYDEAMKITKKVHKILADYAG